MPQSRVIRVNPSEQSIGVGPVGIRFLVTGEDSGGSVSVFEFTVPAGVKLAAPSHRNDAYEEVIYGVKGVVKWTIDGAPFDVGPGQSVCIPRGAVHHFENVGREDALQLTVIAPAVMGPAYFHDAADVVRAAGGGPPDRARMVDVFRRHGMTPAPQPGA
jgi:quercetin dioxygenase-like cupin family protein